MYVQQQQPSQEKGCLEAWYGYQIHGNLTGNFPMIMVNGWGLVPLTIDT